MFTQSYTWAKKRIAELEHHRDALFDQFVAAKAAESALFNRFKQEEYRRQELDTQLSLQIIASRRLQAENQRLQDRMAEHSALLEELEKSRAELKQEQQKVCRLETQLNRRSGKEGYFGLATPSSLKINKPKSTPENQAKKGGAEVGHPGHCRTVFSITEADEVSVINENPSPCTCGCSEWHPAAIKEHCVIERIPAKEIKHFYLKTEFRGRTKITFPSFHSRGRLSANLLVA